MYKLVLLFFVFFNPTVASLAADSSPAPVAAVENKELKKARESIAKKDWPAAIVVLEPYTKNTANDADGFNLLNAFNTRLSKLFLIKLWHSSISYK